MSHRAISRKKIEEDAPHFEVSENLRQFLPPTTHFTIGVRTAWLKVGSRVKGPTDEEEIPVRPKAPKQGQ
jgi:hypothetical protein